LESKLEALKYAKDYPDQCRIVSLLVKLSDIVQKCFKKEKEKVINCVKLFDLYKIIPSLS